MGDSADHVGRFDAGAEGRLSWTPGDLMGSPMNSMPQASRVDRTFARVPDLLVETPSLLSNLWIVDQSTFDRSASWTAEMPTRALAALICAPEMLDTR